MTVRTTIAENLKAGLESSRRRPGLVALLFVPAIMLAAAVSIPLFVVLSAATAPSGFGPVLIERFDMILVTDIMKEAGDGVLAAVVLAFWLVPVILLWKVASTVGLINAVRSGGVRSFWEGVGRFTGAGILISLLNLALYGVWVIASALGVAIVATLMPTGSGPELPFAAGALFMTVGAAMVGLVQDFAKISLICDGKGPVASWREGVRYPFRHPRVVALYGVWWLVAGVISILLIQTHVSRGSSVEQIWLLFFVQQVLLLVRAAVTVAWIGSAVDIHERIRFRESPLLASIGVGSAGTAPPNNRVV